MTTTRNRALIALTVAGLLWGTSVPLSKAALAGFGPGWLTVLRFGIAGVLLIVVLRPRMGGNVRPSVMLWGALGYGGCIAVQNLGLERTSVTHAALLIGLERGGDLAQGVAMNWTQCAAAAVNGASVVSRARDPDAGFTDW